MSVINVSQKGDELVCLEEFMGPPRGVLRSPETNRVFRIGERVRFVSWYRHDNLKDNPVCWMVVFEADDNKEYAATQTYFVTAECWEGLKKHFGEKRRKTPTANRSRATERSSTRKTQVEVTGSKKRRIA